MRTNRSRWNGGALVTTACALGGCNMLVGLDEVNIVDSGAPGTTSAGDGGAAASSGAGGGTASSGGGGTATTTSASGGAGGGPCTDDGDCTPPLVCHLADGACVAPACDDAMLDGDETGLDCGGPLCPPCADGLGCAAASDCQSGVCNGVCQAPTCGDGSQNGGETDVDCGGSCPGKCDDFEGCATGADCQSQICDSRAKQCVPPVCGDGVPNGAEQCDDGNVMKSDGCTAACTLEPGYTCEGTPSLCWTVCGDGVLKGDEQCDDANTASADGCSSSCEVEPFYQCATAPPGSCKKQEVRCNDGIDNDGDNLPDSSDSDCGLPIYAPGPACKAYRIYRAADAPKAIPDGGGATVSRIVVPESFGVGQTSLLLDITHPHAADLDVILVPPFGTPRTVTSGNGDGANYTSTVFHPACFETITMGWSPFHDCYKPESYLPGNGQPAKGTWSLIVEDHTPGASGTLDDWALMLCAQ